jgi:hypothetical protein
MAIQNAYSLKEPQELETGNQPISLSYIGRIFRAPGSLPALSSLKKYIANLEGGRRMLPSLVGREVLYQSSQDQCGSN